MGGFSIWHWIIVLTFLGIPAAIVGLIIWLVVRTSNRSPLPVRSEISPSAPAIRSSAESRLQELDSLRFRGIISDAEYDQQRAAILSSV